jgi:glycosyltransferase involved in cell wall biosynthesis
MRITLINQFYPPELAPTGHLAASLVEHRAALGDEVRVLTGRGGYVSGTSGATTSEGDLVKVHRLWTAGLGKSRVAFRLIDYASFYVQAAVRMLLLPRQDVIITLTTPPLIGLTAALHKCLHPRTRIVLWNMDCYPDAAEAVGLIRRGGLLSRLVRMLVRLQFRTISHLVTLDGAMSQLLLSQYAPAGRVLPTTVIPNWERTAQFPALDLTATDGASAAGGAALGLTILYLGNTGYGHAFDTVLEAARRLRRRPVKFLFIGGGKRWQEIADAKSRDGLDNVELKSYVPKEETPRVMRGADYALITLHNWALGIMSPSKLHSNLAMGLPIIYVGPQGSNVDEAITRFQCGVSLRTDDADGLTAFIEQALEAPQLRAEGSQAARRAFDSQYCDAQTLPMFDAVIAQVVGRACTRSEAPAGSLLASSTDS